ncbi:MAG: metalloregulator ArsR/SmtB family transcription factor [Bacteroidota bacterium]|nr:metalloregulator ArsR/SmtB family transcription factor [Bacteroidota bacterium]
MTMTTDRTEQEIMEEAAAMLKAVAHPVRLAIVGMLEGGVRRNVTDLFGALGLEQAVVSHHLAILRDRGVLSQEREGKHVFYFLRHPRLTEIVHCVKDCCMA